MTSQGSGNQHLIEVKVKDCKVITVDDAGWINQVKSIQPFLKSISKGASLFLFDI